MKNSIIATALSLLIITWGTGYAGSYELIKGQDLEVCQVYEKYINSFDTDEPMICKRPYSEDFPMIERPNWIEVDVNENMDWLMGWYEVQKGIDLSTMTKRSTNQKLQKAVVEAAKAEIIELKKQVRNGQIRMYLSDIDIDNNGSKEKILKIHSSPNAGGCTIDNFGYYRAVVYPATLLMINSEKKVDYKFTNNVIGRLHKTLFLYKEKVFIDRWGSLSTYHGTEKYMQSRYRPAVGGGGLVIYSIGSTTKNENLCELLFTR
ncbi:MAG: hypothetical protein K9L59_14135 [Desulfobacterales bacterium]|nr:hypothetical protein [Desulfobacterales bacterium]